MLTAITLSRDDAGRPYILTADRDEHIRVSRGLPAQAHVIEAYCLGHAHFISRLCVPPRRPDVLVSGGGDNELFVWRWRTGMLLSRVDLLARVRAVVPGVAKIAVAGLHACSLRVGGQGDSNRQEICQVIVFCER
jgi:tRNA (guanine-N(7)-)-methyltransferase subunit TRM82